MGGWQGQAHLPEVGDGEERQGLAGRAEPGGAGQGSARPVPSAAGGPCRWAAWR